MRLRLQEIRRLGSESDDRMASPLSWAWGAHLLARRAQSRLYLLATQTLHLLRSRRHDHRAVAPRLRDAGRAQLRRYPRAVGNRICVLFLTGLSTVAPPEKSACPKALSTRNRSP